MEVFNDDDDNKYNNNFQINITLFITGLISTNTDPNTLRTRLPVIIIRKYYLLTYSMVQSPS